jgi:hypothetical protein
MKELFGKKRFWVALAGVAAVVVNHFIGFDESQVIEVLGAIIAAVFAASAGISAGADRVEAR